MTLTCARTIFLFCPFCPNRGRPLAPSPTTPLMRKTTRRAYGHSAFMSNLVAIRRRRRALERFFYFAPLCPNRGRSLPPSPATPLVRNTKRCAHVYSAFMSNLVAIRRRGRALERFFYFAPLCPNRGRPPAPSPTTPLMRNNTRRAYGHSAFMSNLVSIRRRRRALE